MKINNDEIYKNINFDFSSINLDNSALKTISLFKSNRKWLISKYIIDIKNENYKIERISANNFLQSLASVSDEKFDYRKNERKFKELPDNLFDCDLRAMLKFTSFKIGRYTKNINLQLQPIIHLYSVKMVENLQIHQKEYAKME